MRVCVLAFARVRELLGEGSFALETADGGTVQDVWNVLTQRAPALKALAASTRVARNGRVVAFAEALTDGDEVALLPPVGGG
jgi:MoaD family protein